MQHNFDVDLAVQYGVLEAVLLNNLQYWVAKNEANNTNYYDGRYWTYNSTKAFTKLFPYATQKRIQTALKHLIDDGIITTGNYNPSAYDRTLWYSFTEKGKCIMSKSKMENAEKENGEEQKEKPIPNIKPDIKSNNKTYNIYGEYKRVKLTDDEYKRLINEFGEQRINDVIEQLDEYVESNNNKNKYTNYNLVIRKAIRENWFKAKETKQSSFDVTEFFQSNLNSKRGG